MPPAKKDHVDRRVEAILECASKTLNILREKAVIPESLGPGMESHIKQSLPLHSTPVVVEKASTFDSLGTDLWNYSAQLVHDAERDPRARTVDRAHVGVLIRVFALLLLDTAHRSSVRRAKDPDQQVRVLKVALRTSRLCLDRNALELAIKALEICSQKVTVPTSEPPPLMRIAETSPTDEKQDEVNLKTLTAEYYLLRLMHAWKSSRLDLADHFYIKFNALQLVNMPELSVKEADLFDEIARSLSKTKQPQDATKWFERAFQALEKCDDEATTQEAAELKLCVGVSLVEQLLVDGQSSAISRAWTVVDQLEKTHGLQSRVTVDIIKFQVMASGDQVDADQVYQTLLRVVKLTQLTEESFKGTMRTMRQAINVSATPTLAALKVFICNRLLPELQNAPPGDTIAQVWLEKATITYILLATSPSQGLAAKIDIPAIKELLDEVSSVGEMHFSPKATHAAQTLLWKVAGTLETWASCQLLRHPLFLNAGHLNKARVGRKLMRHALEHGDLPVAREAFFQMPKDAREESLSQFLAFRLALQSQDEDLAADCLRNVAKNAIKDPNHLYACVIEAQRSPMRHMAVMALQALLGQRPPGIHLACLLRCTVRLLIAELDAAANNQKLNEVAFEVLQVFESAAQSVDAFRQASNDSWRTEIQWWSKNAYNLSIRLCADVDPEYTVRYLNVCAAFMKHYPSDGSLMQQDDIEARKMLCAFLSTTALVVLGRAEDRGPEHTLQCFLLAQAQISIFNAQYTKVRPKLQNEAAVTAEQRAFAILKFELECILKLGQFDKLASVLQSCLDTGSRGGTGRWDTLADLLIIIHHKLDSSDSENTALITALLQKIINDTWKIDKDITKVARWLRYTFMLCMNNMQSDFSLKLLQQAANMAENGHRGKHDPYPESELQWLATTGFNHAIDLLAESNGEGAMRWMESSLEVARWSQDDGSLHAILTGKQKIVEERIKSHQG